MDDNDWSNDASFDLANIDTNLALLPQATGSSASSNNANPTRTRAHRSSSSFSSRSSTSSSVGQSPLQVNSPLRHSFTRDTAPEMALGAFREKPDDAGEVDFDEGFGDAFADDGEPPARVKLSLGSVNGLNADRAMSTGVGTVKGRGTSASSSGSMQGVMSSGTFMGVGPKGIGTITKLGGTAVSAGTSKSTNLSSVKARAKAWEADSHLGMDDEDGFGDRVGGNKGTIKVKAPTSAPGGGGGGAPLQLKLPNRPLPPPEDLDDLGFDLSNDERKDDDATLKAGTTLKAMLPPPRPKSSHLPSIAASTTAADTSQKADAEADFDLETDIVLPLNLTNLVLATKSHPTARNHAPPLSSAKGPRRSDSSTSDTFGSISTGTNEWGEHANHKSKVVADATSTPSSRTPYSHNTSVSDRLKYYSETSATSIDEPAELSSPSPSATYRYTAADTIKANAHGGMLAKGLIRPPTTGPIGTVDPEWQEDDMELDMESGLVLPDPTFFAAGAQRSKELNGLLDRKRKQHYAPAPDVAAASTYSSRARSALGGREVHDDLGVQKARRPDESMEDGFVFDNPRVELSNTRLKTQRRMRGGDPHVNPAHAGGSVRVSKRDREGPGLKSIARSKEAGWRYQQNRSESPFTTTAFAAQHASPAPAQLPTASSRDASNPTPTPNRQMQVGSMRTRTQSAMHQPSPGGTSSMFPATHTPAAAAGAAGTITPGRLRYQKSHQQISSVRGTSGHGGRSTSPTPLGAGGGTLLRKQSLASLQDAMKRGTPAGSSFDNARVGGTIKAASAFASIPSASHHGTGTIDGLPGSATRDSLASLSSYISATPSKGDRERYHASTSRLTMPTSSSRAKTRPPIAGVFSRAGLGGADSPAPSSSAAGLAALAETDPIESRRISPPRNAAISTTPSRVGARRLVEPAQLLVPLSKRKPAQPNTTAMGGASASNTGSFGRKTRQWGDGSELEGIEDLVVDDAPEGRDTGSLGRKSKGGSVGRSGGIGLGRPSVPRKDSQNDTTAARAPRPATADDKDKEKRHRSKTRAEDKSAAGKDASTTGGGSLRKKTKRPAMLIKHLGGVDKRKVVGEMTWNPHTLRWEGNESILASFDPPSTSPPNSRPNSKAGAVRPGARPALITHLTPGTIGLASVGDAQSRLTGPSNIGNPSKILTSPDKDRYSTIRIVGDMQFDPQKMCWVSLVPEEDAFEGMADDEDEDWGSGAGAGGTIRGSKGLLNIGANAVQGRMTSTSTTDTHWTHGTTGTQISLATAGSGSTFGPSAAGGRPRESFGSVISDSSPSKSSTGTVDGQDRQWQAAISPDLWAECQAAEERHRKEVKGWCVRSLPPPPGAGAASGGSAGRAAQAAQAQWIKDVQERERREGKRLWEIRTLAMRS